MKKFLLTLSLPFVILSCQCWGISSSEWEIESVDLDIRDDIYGEPINSVIFADSLKLIVNLVPRFVRNTMNMNSGLWALTCAEPGDEGLADRIISATVSSEFRFNAFESGESLNSIIKVDQGSIEDLINDDSIFWDYRTTSRIEMTLTEKPRNTTLLNLRLEIVTESGERIVGSTGAFNWK